VRPPRLLLLLCTGCAVLCGLYSPALEIDYRTLPPPLKPANKAHSHSRRCAAPSSCRSTTRGRASTMEAVSVACKGIDAEIDGRGKEFVIFTFGVRIGAERVHTISGRYSELSKQYKDLPKLLPGCGAKFPGKHISVVSGISRAESKTDRGNVNRRARELCAYFSALLVRGRWG
jgi:hypothetical protein